MALYRVVRVDEDVLAAAVERVKAKLDPNDVRLIRYWVGDDIFGETTIFFRILLSDDASQRSRLGEVSKRVRGLVYDEVKPAQNWGIIPEFRFRSESELRARPDPEWA